MTRKADPTAAPRHIIVAEDSPVQAKKLCRLLEDNGFRVTHVLHGYAALEAARADPPTAVISDVMMPELDGFGLCRLWQQDPELRPIPIVLLTSLSDPTSIIKALQAGADSFITKPYADDYLLSHLEFVIARRSVRDTGASADGDATEIVYNGERFVVQAERQQMLNLLLSVFAAAVQRNSELERAKDDLQRLNEQLEEKVQERAAALLAENAERRQAEVALRESEETFRSLFTSSRDALLLLDDGVIIDCNPAALELLGLSSYDDLVSQPATSFWPPVQPDGRQTAAKAEAYLAAALETGRELFESECQRADRTTFPAEVLLSRIELQGRTMLQTSVRDITERRRAEETNRHWAAAMEGTTNLVIMTDTAGVIRYVNRAFVQTTFYSEDEARGEGLQALLRTTVDDDDGDDLWSAVRSGKVWEGQLVNQRRDGEEFTVWATVTPILAADGAVLECVWLEQDITEKLEAQRRLSRAQTLEAVGQLSGGIAHDFNNLLQVVIGNAELLGYSLPANAEEFEFVEQIQDVARRGARLVRQLLLFSRQEVDEPEVLDLNEVVRDVDKLLRRTIGEDIELVVELDDRLPNVLLSGVQLQQVLMNLAVNARDAMPTGGRLRIETRHLPSQTGEGLGEVGLRVSDTGAGMPPEVLAKAFEPYFSTKEKVGGTGLGLATVYGVVHQADGRISVESRVGCGTTFELIFPATGEDDATTAAGTGSAAAALGSGETVLVVDDEEPIREIIRRLLTRHGYQVLEASTGAEALALAAGVKSIDLLFADVVMPGMSGPAVAEQLLARWPGLRVLFMSGYADDRLFVHGLPREEANFISKPFTTAELLVKLREVIGGV